MDTSRHYKEYFKAPSLYLNDLLDIERQMKQNQRTSDYSIKVGNIKYKSVNEIPKDKMFIEELLLSTRNPSRSLIFDANQSKIYTNEDDSLNMGVIKKISDIIKKRERKWIWFLNKILRNEIVVSITFSTIYLPILLFVSGLKTVNLVWPFRILLAVLTLFVITKTLRFSQIQLSPVEHKPSMFQKYKREISKIIFFGVIQLAFEKLIKAFFP